MLCPRHGLTQERVLPAVEGSIAAVGNIQEVVCAILSDLPLLGGASFTADNYTRNSA
jgi:hypothetical protein